MSSMNGEEEVYSARTEKLTQAYEKLDQDVLFGDIPLTSDDLSILREVRRSLQIFCPKWYKPTVYNKQVVDPLISHLVAIGYRAARNSGHSSEVPGEESQEA